MPHSVPCDNDDCQNKVAPLAKATPEGDGLERGFRCLYCLALLCEPCADNHFELYHEPACGVELGKALKDIAGMPKESHEWDAVAKYKEARERAERALNRWIRSAD